MSEQVIYQEPNPVKVDTALYVLIEGHTGYQLVSKVLEDEADINRIKIYEEDNYSSALSGANTLLIKKPDAKVVMIVGAESSQDGAIRERRSFVHSYLKRFIFRDNQFKLILLAPEIETVFFDSKELTEHIVGREVHDLEVEVGRLSPVKTLKEKFGIDPKNMIDLLSPEVIHLIKQQSVFKEIKDFINT